MMTLLMPTEYLSKDQIDGFNKYKYSCKDTSYLSIYVMHPFWNWLVQYFPSWVAPNVLTFSGFIFTVLVFLMFTWLDYDFWRSDIDLASGKPLPNWSFLLAAVFIFIAYTLDGTDGKQARRTDTSGPLGELFDHGLDSYTAGIIPIACYSIFSRGLRFSISPLRMYFVLWNILVNFFLAHWEKYNTGVLFLPWGYDFSMWGTVILFATAGIFGADIWQTKVQGRISAIYIFEIGVHCFGIITNAPIVAFNVYKSYRDRTGYMRSFSEAIRPILPIVWFFVIMLFWIVTSPSNILSRDPRIVYILVSTVFSNICCRLIVAQMSSTRCDSFNFLIVPVLATIIISSWTQNAPLEITLTYILTCFTTLAHIHYGTYVVQQMCRHFGINCFKIKKRQD